MSAAEELLNNLAGATTYSEEVDYVFIGEDRFMVVPEHLKKLGVSPDHGVTTVHFVGPRYSQNGTDLSKMSIWVNYMRSDDYPDQSRCENVKVDSEDDTLLHYDWVISRNVTEIHGNVTALVCAKEVDAAGNEQNHWNSEMYKDFYVSEGMEVDGDSIIGQYPDLVEYILLRVATVENKTTKAAMLSYVEQYLNDDPSVIIENIEEIIAGYPIEQFVKDYLDDYVDICTTENRTLEGGFAGAYEMVSMEGASEQITTEGYQLFDHTASEFATFTTGGATVTNNGDGSFTVSGSGALTANVSKYHYYTLAESAKLFKAGKLKLKCDGTTTVPKIYIHPQQNGTSLATLAPDGNKEFEITQEMIDSGTFRVVLGIYSASGQTIVPGTMRPMLYQDGDGEFEIFTGGEPSPSPEYEQEIKSVGSEVTVRTTNNNLYHNLDTGTATVSGITITREADTSEVVLNGTATKEMSVPAAPNLKIPKGTYTISVQGLNVANTSVDRILVNKVGNGAIVNFIQVNRPKTFTLEEDAELNILIICGNGSSYNNRTIRIQIEPGEVATDFIPHQESSATITLPDELRGINDVSDVIEKRDSKWGVWRKFHTKTYDENSGFTVNSVKDSIASFYINFPDKITLHRRRAVLCDKLRVDICGSDNKGNVYVCNSNLGGLNFLVDLPTEVASTLDEFNTWIAEYNLNVVYEMAEPVWEELDDTAQKALDDLLVFDDITYVFVDGTDVQPIVTSKYGTSHTGATVITQANEIEKLKEQIGDVNTILEQLIGGE